MSLGEIVLISIIALIFIGPKQLPEVAKVLGKIFAELKRATSDLSGVFIEAQRAQNIKETIKNEVTKELTKEISDDLKEIKKDVQS